MLCPHGCRVQVLLVMLPTKGHRVQAAGRDLQPHRRVRLTGGGSLESSRCGSRRRGRHGSGRGGGRARSEGRWKFLAGGTVPVVVRRRRPADARGRRCHRPRGEILAAAAVGKRRKQQEEEETLAGGRRRRRRRGHLTKCCCCCCCCRQLEVRRAGFSKTGGRCQTAARRRLERGCLLLGPRRSRPGLVAPQRKGRDRSQRGPRGAEKEERAAVVLQNCSGGPAAVLALLVAAAAALLLRQSPSFQTHRC